uniref:patatin-like phospholipase family protein n=1 Tax=Bacillus altitudinis TaxID=293387 RepID=UPI00307F18E5
MKGRIIGLVLGSGGGRGMGDMGVLCSVEKEGIEVDMMGGRSIGGVVGRFYAGGQEVEKMKKVGLVLRRKYY